MNDLSNAPSLGPLRTYIVDTLLNGRDVTADENLLLSGLLDSLSVMSLVEFIEQTYGFSVPFDDVIIENFMSLDAIGAYVQGRMTQ